MGKFRKVDNSAKSSKKINISNAWGGIKTFCVKNIWCLIAIAITAIYLVGTMFGIRGSEMPSTYYQTGNHDAKYYTVCVYEISLKESQKIDSVWVNLGSIDYKVHEKTDANKNDLKADGTKKSIEIYAGRADKTSSNFTVSQKPLKLDNDFNSAKIGGYHMLYEYPTGNTYKYLAIATKNTIKINEIAVVGYTDTTGGFAEYEMLEVKAVASGAKGTTHSSTLPPVDTAWSTSLESGNNTVNSVEGKVQASKLVDEQSSFSLAKVDFANRVYDNSDIVSQSEYEYINSARNIANGEGQFVKEGITSLGSLLTYLGMLIGGAGAFGIKFFAVLFGAGVVLLSYFIANKFNKASKGYSLIASGVMAVALYFGAVYAFNFIPALFFFTLAELFIINYVFDKTNGSTNGLVMMMLSGLAFSLSVTLNAFAMFTILPLGAGVVMGTIYRNKGSEQSIALVKDIIIAVVSFIVLPCLLLLVSFIPTVGTFGSIFDTSNTFSIIAKQFFTIL